MIIIKEAGGTTHEHVEELVPAYRALERKGKPGSTARTPSLSVWSATPALLTRTHSWRFDPQVENIIKVQEPFKLANRKVPSGQLCR